MMLRTRPRRQPAQYRSRRKWFPYLPLVLLFLLLMTSFGSQTLAQEPVSEPTPVPLGEVKEAPEIAPASSEGAPASHGVAPASPQAPPPAVSPVVGPPNAGIVPAVPVNISLDIRDLDTGLPIPEFTYLVNIDNAADNSDPDPLNHASVNPMASYSPIAAAGDETTAGSIVVDTEERYLISVRADGYKLWGRHIRFDGAGNLVDGDGNAITGPVRIDLVPHPLPLAQIQVYVFQDFAPVDGFPEFPAESAAAGAGLEGFNVVVEDIAGQVIVDWFGNPICAEYDGNGDYIPGTGGQCLTDANGSVTIRNLPPNKYEIEAVPPMATPKVGPRRRLLKVPDSSMSGRRKAIRASVLPVNCW